MKFPSFRLLVFLLTLMIGAAPSMAVAAPALKGEAEISGPVVRLSDVFNGLPEGVDCDIASAPLPGKSITYNVSTLSYLAKQYQLDWKPASLADHMVITSAAARITADDIGKAVVEKLKDQDVKGIINVLFDNHALAVNLPTDQPSDFALNNFEYDATNKRFHADFVAESDSGPLTFPVTGRIAIQHSVPVLVHRLESGTVIGAADIDWMAVSDDRMGGVVTNADQLIGHELRRDTDGDQPLHEHDIIPARLVVRGTLVTMKIETPLMVITAQGKALQDGAMGDVVRINNSDSNRMIEGTVSGPGLVTVSGSQKFAAVP
jgi:flagella basal body P-ring formation protein FlgA